MMPEQVARVAIVDYGLGNLLSVKLACEHVGLRAHITSESRELDTADAVILPGVGAFGAAMETLRRLDLIRVLRDVAASGKPLMGICLGMQLLMTQSEEFGCHEGLGILEGTVVRLRESAGAVPRVKIPQVGWNRISSLDVALNAAAGRTGSPEGWRGTFLEGVPNGAYMYFVHSYYPRPADPHVVLSMTSYGEVEFCSSLRRGRIFACQFHPERSGPDGLRLYHNLARMVGVPVPLMVEARDA